MQIAISGQAEDARVAAEASLQAMARLMAVAGHDLRQPIQVAMLSIARAISETEPAAVTKRLRMALDAMKRLGAELEDIARLSQQGGALRPKLQSVDVDEVLADVERDWRVYADACGTCLEIRASLARVETDPAMLKSILRNLVGNAIRHGGRGGHVLITCRPQRDRLSIEVQDSGDGIPSAYLSRIFDAFERRGTAGSDDGLGLGLTIVRQTAALLGHPVSVRSVEGLGSTFSVELPLQGVVFPSVVATELVRERSN